MMLKKHKKYVKFAVMSLFALMLIPSLFPNVSSLGIEYIENNDFNNPGDEDNILTTKTDLGAYPVISVLGGQLWIFNKCGIYYDVEPLLNASNFECSYSFVISTNGVFSPSGSIGTGYLWYITENTPVADTGSHGSYDGSIGLKGQTNGTYSIISNMDGSSGYEMYNLVPARTYYFHVTAENNGTAIIYNAWIRDVFGVNHYIVTNITRTWHSLVVEHYLNIGPLAYGSGYQCPDMHFDNLIISYHDPSPPPLTPTSGTDPTLEKMVFQIVFFLPAIVMTTFLGKVGMISGLGLMSLVYTFTEANFTWAGILIFMVLGVYVYRGGL